jgi:hypothetical protein
MEYFARDFRVARVFGHPEVHLAGADLRSIRLFRKRLDDAAELRRLQAFAESADRAGRPKYAIPPEAPAETDGGQ